MTSGSGIDRTNDSLLAAVGPKYLMNGKRLSREELTASI